MADKTHIEWTDATWNPVTGCSIVSTGCKNCYAMKLAGTRLRHHPSRAGLTVDSSSGPVWNGEVRFNEGWLLQPLGWKKPRNIFVCAHGDLFHESVPDAWIDRVFAVMALAPQHKFQVLTKRSARMRDYVSGAQTRIIKSTRDGHPHVSVLTARTYSNTTRIGGAWPWPLSNVWLGVSAERQQEADARIPDLLATPAAVRFISAEPLLAPIDLRNIRRSIGEDSSVTFDALSPGSFDQHNPVALDWIIVGGESGDGARAMHPQWARSLRDQCAAAGVSFFFKQWGNWAPSTEEQAAGNPRSGWKALSGNALPKQDELYPSAGAAFVEHMPKAVAGRLLDGIEHNAMPVRR